MLKLKKLRMPKPVNLNDCVLLWQMGDSVINYAQTFVTAKGVDYIRRLLDKQKTA